MRIPKSISAVTYSVVWYMLGHIGRIEICCDEGRNVKIPKSISADTYSVVWYMLGHIGRIEICCCKE